MNLRQRALELCHEIENLPASEQQTSLSVKASDLYNAIAQQESAIDVARKNLSVSEEPFYEGMKILNQIGTDHG